jgi:hypothetical protein
MLAWSSPSVSRRPAAGTGRGRPLGQRSVEPRAGAPPAGLEPDALIDSEVALPAHQAAWSPRSESNRARAR